MKLRRVSKKFLLCFMYETEKGVFEMADQKPFSVRADQEVIDKYSEIAEAAGLKKSELLPVLLASYAQEQAKAALPGRGTEIDHVESLLNQLKDAYLHSLEINANAEARIRQEFAARIENNEQAVASLKAKADAAVAKEQEAKAALDAVTAERDELKTRAENVDAALEKLRDESAKQKDQLEKFNKSLQEQVTDMREKIEASKAELEAAAELEKQSADLKFNLKAAEDRAEKSEAEAADLRKKLEDAKVRADADRVELKGRYDEKMDNLRDKLENEKQAAVLAERQKQQEAAAAKMEKAEQKYAALLLRLEEKAGSKNEPAKDEAKPKTEPVKRRGRPRKQKPEEDAAEKPVEN